MNQQPDHFKAQMLFAMTLARIERLAKTIYSMPALYVFVVVYALSYLPKGFKPLPFLSTTWEGWLLGVFNGFFIAWTLVFTGFIQNDNTYKGIQINNIKGSDFAGNKVIPMYLVWILVGGLFYGLEWSTAGTATHWLFIVCAFVVITPLFLGKTLQDQAKRIMPLFAQIAIIATMIWFIGWNTSIPALMP